MVNLETLTARSLCRYELGRLRMAARVGLVLLPLVALCLLEPVGRLACSSLALLLLVSAIALRFRSRAGVESVTTGLLAGSIALTATLVLSCVDPGCASAGPVSFCSGFSLLIGGVAGAAVALREHDRASISGHWLLAASIALLTASLGCVRLGLASVAGVALGIVVGRATARSSRAHA